MGDLSGDVSGMKFCGCYWMSLEINIL